MATIGTVQYGEDKNRYFGTLNTLTIKAAIELVPTRKTNDAQPDYRIVSGGIEIGAAWKRMSERSGNEYVSLSFEAPEFGRTRLFANLGKMPGQDDPNLLSVIWNADDCRA